MDSNNIRWYCLEGPDDLLLVVCRLTVTSTDVLDLQQRTGVAQLFINSGFMNLFQQSPSMIYYFLFQFQSICLNLSLEEITFEVSGDDTVLIEALEKNNYQDTGGHIVGSTLMIQKFSRSLNKNDTPVENTQGEEDTEDAFNFTNFEEVPAGSSTDTMGGIIRDLFGALHNDPEFRN
jgi:hypothetical protein